MEPTLRTQAPEARGYIPLKGTCPYRYPDAPRVPVGGQFLGLTRVVLSSGQVLAPEVAVCSETCGLDRRTLRKYHSPGRSVSLNFPRGLRLRATAQGKGIGA